MKRRGFLGLLAGLPIFSFGKFSSKEKENPNNLPVAKINDEGTIINVEELFGNSRPIITPHDFYVYLETRTSLIWIPSSTPVMYSSDPIVLYYGETEASYHFTKIKDSKHPWTSIHLTRVPNSSVVSKSNVTRKISYSTAPRLSGGQSE